MRVLAYSNFALESQLSQDAGCPVWPARRGGTFMRQVSPSKICFLHQPKALVSVMRIHRLQDGLY